MRTVGIRVMTTVVSVISSEPAVFNLLAVKRASLDLMAHLSLLHWSSSSDPFLGLIRRLGSGQRKGLMRTPLLCGDASE